MRRSALSTPAVGHQDWWWCPRQPPDSRLSQTSDATKLSSCTPPASGNKDIKNTTVLIRNKQKDASGEIMFSILAQNWRRGWQNFEKKTGEALAETVFFSKFCLPRSRFWKPKLKTLSRQIMFYVIHPEPMKILGNFEHFGNFGNFWNTMDFGFSWKILN